MFLSLTGEANRSLSLTQYELVVKVPFPGLGNDVKLEAPVTVSSGIDELRPHEKGVVDGTEPPPTLDLPPYVPPLLCANQVNVVGVQGVLEHY